MYNLSVDEISMVDGGGDGNSSGYPASPSAVQQMSGPQGDAGRAVLNNLASIAGGIIGAAGSCPAAATGIGAAGCIASGVGIAQGAAGLAGGRGL